MKVFVDASALISIIAQEADARPLGLRLAAAKTRLCSAVSVWETAAGLCRSYNLSPDIARGRTENLLVALDIAQVPIGPPETELALEAYARFGKGRHKAALNMGDCFAYACARSNAARLLYKGNDFAQTDIEPAA